MNIVVTGGAGFIGSQLAENFLAEGHTVKVIDNLSTGRIENLALVMDHPNLEFIRGTVTDMEAMRPLIAWCDQCYHLAAPVGVKFIMDNPVLTILDNIRGIDVVMTLVKEYRKRVMVASTSEVYGRSLDFLDDTGTRKLREDDYRIEGSSMNHRWAYANTKSMDEFLSLAYHKEFGTEVVVVRFFNTVGPRQLSVYGMVIPNFVERALRGEDVIIFGTGRQQRSFMHVNDVVRAVKMLVAEGKGIGQVFNVGNPEEISMNDLAAKIIAKCGSKSAIKHISYEEAYGKGFEDMDRRTADITKLCTTTGFRLEYNLDALLDDIIANKKKVMAMQS